MSLFKVELTEANVEKAIDFFIENTVVPSALDGKAIMRLIVHDSNADLGREICKSINESRNDVAVSRVSLSWDFDLKIDEEEDVEIEYGWFLNPV
jgi:hypothetical protein